MMARLGAFTSLILAMSKMDGLQLFLEFDDLIIVVVMVVIVKDLKVHYRFLVTITLKSARVSALITYLRHRLRLDVDRWIY